MVKIPDTLTTEKVNERTRYIDVQSTADILKIMNEEDQLVAHAVKQSLPQIEVVVDGIYEVLRNKGKLYYIGAGTSGRIGILDAAECPPTFSTPLDRVQAIIAGGEAAMTTSVENAEDDVEQGQADLDHRKVSPADAVVGITASGRTPYVKGALLRAREIGAYSVAISCNKNAEISALADNWIEVEVGPEVITGSTRMKAATAQKMMLNMITTAVMIKLGKVYENLMVDLQVSNHKLRRRAVKIITSVTSVTEQEAELALQQCQMQVKPAIVMLKKGVSYEQAQRLLQETGGMVRLALENDKSHGNT